VPANSATIAPGTRGSSRRSTIITDSATAPNAVAAGDQVPKCAASAAIRALNSDGTAAICSPKKSRICVLAISTAIPLVKPMTTGRGRYFTAVPMPVRPRTTSSTPAIIVHMNSPSMP
jgi:hypothetical protein